MTNPLRGQVCDRCGFSFHRDQQKQFHGNEITHHPDVCAGLLRRRIVKLEEILNEILDAEAYDRGVKRPMPLSSLTNTMAKAEVLMGAEQENGK